MVCGEMGVAGEREEEETEDTEGEVRLAWEETAKVATGGRELSPSLLSVTGLYLPAQRERTLCMTNNNNNNNNNIRIVSAQYWD